MTFGKQIIRHKTQEVISSMINHLMHRQFRNRPRPTAESSSASSAHANLDEVASAARAYFARIPAAPGRIDINRDQPVENVVGFRALRTVMLAEGWSVLEPWGVWSEGNLATLYIKNPLADSPTVANPHSTEIALDARGAVFESLPRVTVRCELGSARSETVFVWGEPSAVQITLTVPEELAKARVFRLRMSIESPRSPHDQTDGVSPDRRQIGVGISAIEIRPREHGREFGAELP
jgi:hypothetical protein